MSRREEVESQLRQREGPSNGVRSAGDGPRTWPARAPARMGQNAPLTRAGRTCRRKDKGALWFRHTEVWGFFSQLNQSCPNLSYPRRNLLFLPGKGSHCLILQAAA